MLKECGGGGSVGIRTSLVSTQEILEMFFDVQQNCTEPLTSACYMREVTFIAAVFLLECKNKKQNKRGKVERLQKIGEWESQFRITSWLLAAKICHFPYSTTLILSNSIFEK